MIKWLKRLFHKEHNNDGVFYEYVLQTQIAVYNTLKGRKYYNVRDSKGRFTKLKGKKNG